MGKSVIAVIDGLGGGIGCAIIKALKGILGEEVEILALGTNATATQAMLKAGGDKGASGENAIVLNSRNVDIIVGTLGIVLANSMLGEITPKMAEAITSSKAVKFLIPMKNLCRVSIVGESKEPIPKLIEELASEVRRYLKEGEVSP